MRNKARKDQSGTPRDLPLAPGPSHSKKPVAHVGRRDSPGETGADPLEILIVPHAVIEWQLKRKMLVKRFFPQIAKAELEKGKYAIFHGKTRLNELFDDPASAHARIFEIVGEKKKCWENKRIFTVRQL